MRTRTEPRMSKKMKRLLELKMESYTKRYNEKANKRLQELEDYQLKNINMFEYESGYYQNKFDAFKDALRVFKNEFNYGIIKKVKFLYQESSKEYTAWVHGQVAWDQKSKSFIR